MIKKQISYERALNFGFSSFVDNIFTFFMLWVSTMVLSLVAFILLILAWVPSAFFSALAIPLPRVFMLITVPFGIFFSFSILTLALAFFLGFYHYQMVRFSLAIYEGRPLPWKQFFAFSWRPFIPFCIARFIRWFFIVLGCILFIIPAIYWACKYYFAGYSLVDSTNELVTEDREYTKKITQGVKWQILGFILLLYVLSFLVAFTLMFALPIIYLAQVHAYKQLEEQVEAQERGVYIDASHRYKSN